MNKQKIEAEQTIRDKRRTDDADELLVMKFLGEQCSKPIPDKGFTRKVVNRTPEILLIIGRVLQVAGAMAAMYLLTMLFDFTKLSQIGHILNHLHDLAQL